MNNFFKLSLIVSLIIGCSTPIPKEQQYKKLDKYLDILAKNEKSMGSVLIVSKDKVEYEKNYGFKDLPPNPIYRIGSISKTYTAVIIGRLVEDGFLKYEDKVSKYYPSIPNAQDITIEHLLKHRSGLVNFTDTKSYLSFSEKPSSEKMHIKRAIKDGVDFKPNEKYSYSNTGYVLLSLIAEKVSKKSFSNLLQDYIAKPLGLKNTYLYSSVKPRTNEVKSYDLKKKWVVSTNTHETIPLGAGAIASNAREVSQFFQALFQEKLVSIKTLERMKKFEDGYGHGLFSFPYNKQTGIGHTGGIDGFRSVAGYFPDSDLVFVQLSNAAVININDISVASLAAYHGDEFKLPSFKKVTIVDPKILKKYIGEFKSDQHELGIKVFLKNGELFAKADGQSSFPLEAYSDTEFGFPPARIKINFKSDGNGFDIIQRETISFKRVSKN